MAFDEEKAAHNLFEREKAKADANEKRRLELLEYTKKILLECFSDSSVEIFLIGSILQKGKFHSGSDIDIVLKGYSGDRFEIWTHLERKLNLSLEIIYYEEISFQEDIEKNGLRIK